jgi:hypothetical protein
LLHKKARAKLQFGIFASEVCSKTQLEITLPQLRVLRHTLARLRFKTGSGTWCYKFGFDSEDVILKVVGENLSQKSKERSGVQSAVSCQG